jgi:hypothetical protein
MAEEQRSKVAPRRLRGSIAGLVQRGRGLYEAMAALEHNERCERLLAAMPRVRSPKPTLVKPAKAPEPSTTAKPLVFRKTKRELQREQEVLELERAAKRHRQQVEREERTSVRKASATTDNSTTARRPTKCARVLFATTCRQYRRRSRALQLAGRGRPRRRLQF